MVVLGPNLIKPWSFAEVPEILGSRAIPLKTAILAYIYPSENQNIRYFHTFLVGKSLNKVMPLPKILIPYIGWLLCGLLQTAAGQSVVVESGGDFSDPEYLVKEVLLGDGIEASNIQFSGHPDQIGVFSQGLNTLDMEQGIIMSTGLARELEVTNDYEDRTSVIGPGITDGDLLQLSQRVVFLLDSLYGTQIEPVENIDDAAILEFDFIPSSDSVTFQYVFASEEYDQWINTKYNDMFGFFISGPGIQGSYSAPPGTDGARNIAVLPGTQLPITVSSVHNGNSLNDPRNSDYFVDNCTAVNEKNHCLNEGISYNGYTVKLTARAKVVPCETYHIKLAIADGTLRSLDSGVLLEAKSFSSASIEVSDNLEDFPNNTAREGCIPIRLDFKRSSNLSSEQQIDLIIEPSSTADISDLSGFQPQISFPANSQTTSLTFFLVEDGLAEGPEDLFINIDAEKSCFKLSQPIRITIEDYQPVVVPPPLSEDINAKCSTIELTLDPGITGGVKPWVRWSVNGQTQENNNPVFSYFPADQDLVQAAIVDTCRTDTVFKRYRIHIEPLPPIVFELPADTLLPCRDGVFDLIPEELYGGTNLFQVRYYHKGQLIGIGSPGIQIPVSEAMEIVGVATDECGVSERDTMNVDIPLLQPLDLFVSPDTTICIGQQLTLKANASGGAGNYVFDWNDGQFSGEKIPVQPDQKTSYRVEVSDACGESDFRIITVDVNNPILEFEYEYIDDFSIAVRNYSQVDRPSYTWLLDDIPITVNPDPVITFNDVWDHQLTLVARDIAGCTDSLTKTILPQLRFFIPNAFSPDGDGLNDVFQVEGQPVDEFRLIIYDRWGGVVFTTDSPHEGWNGVLRGTGKKRQGSYAFFLSAKRGFEKYQIRGFFSLIL